jgi:hypothetical protein
MGEKYNQYFLSKLTYTKIQPVSKARHCELPPLNKGKNGEDVFVIVSAAKQSSIALPQNLL